MVARASGSSGTDGEGFGGAAISGGARLSAGSAGTAASVVSEVEIFGFDVVEFDVGIVSCGATRAECTSDVDGECASGGIFIVARGLFECALRDGGLEIVGAYRPPTFITIAGTRERRFASGDTVIETNAIGRNIVAIVCALTTIDGATHGEVELTRASPSWPIAFVGPATGKEDSAITPAFKLAIGTAGDTVAGVTGGTGAFDSATGWLATFGEDGLGAGEQEEGGEREC